MEVVRLKKEDCKELVAFLDQVFTLQNGHQMDFAGSFPRIFQENDENMGWYYAVKEDGKIIGTAASHPLYYRVGEDTLKVSAGGNVAVSPDHRNRGIMQQLLNRIDADLTAEGYDFAYLHGDRKRYRTFGFEKCGTEYLVYFTPSMLAKEDCRPDVILGDLRYEPEFVQETVWKLANRQYSGFAWKKEEFMSALLAHKYIPMVIRKDGWIIGHLTLDVAGAYIADLSLDDDAVLGQVLAAVSEYLGGKSTLVMRIPAYEAARLRRAITISGRYNIIQTASFRICNWEKVLSVFLKAKGHYAPLAEGSLVVEAELFGKWEISCKDGQVSVVSTQEPADVYLPSYRAYEFFFGPNDPFFAEVAVDLPREKALLVANWFPLPLFCPHLA